jgi:hypothetical protein
MDFGGGELGISYAEDEVCVVSRSRQLGFDVPRTNAAGTV